jgi:hypothetical protein
MGGSGRPPIVVVEAAEWVALWVGGGVSACGRNRKFGHIMTCEGGRAQG